MLIIQSSGCMGTIFFGACGIFGFWGFLSFFSFFGFFSFLVEMMGMGVVVSV